MARLDPSIRHAITPPEFGEDKLHRAKLVDRLHGEIPRKLVAIAAPAGYGKTTLLADFVAHTELPVVWVHATELDRDVMRLASVLKAALEKRFRRLADKLDLRAYAGGEAADLAMGFIELIDQYIPENFVLIIDDVQFLHPSVSAVNFLDHLILGLPEQATVIASGREVLEISLARLMAQDDLAGFGPHDLSLMRDEIASVVRLTGGKKELSDIELDNLQELTQGWVTGVVLSPYGSEEALTANLSEPLVYEYLSSVVLNQQPDDLRRFALDAAVFPVMTVDACEEVLGVDNPSEYFERLTARNLFILSTGGDERTFVFHPMFRDHLIRTAKASNQQRFLELFSEAASYLSKESPEIAIEMYLGRGEFKSASGLIQSVAKELYQAGRFSTLIRWFEMLPEPINQAPELHFYYAMVAASRGMVEEAMAQFGLLLNKPELTNDLRIRILIAKCLRLIHQGGQSEAKQIISSLEGEQSSIDTLELKAGVIRARARYLALIEGRYLEAARLLETAISELSNADEKYLLAAALQDQAMCYGFAGNLHEARRSTLSSYELSKEIGSPSARIAALRNMAYAELLIANFQESLKSLEKARALANRLENSSLKAEFIFSQADIFRDIGLKIPAAELYEQGLQIASEMPASNVASVGCLGVATLHRRSGNYRLANEWLQRANELSTAQTDKVLLRLEQVAVIAKANPSEAIEILIDLKNQSEEIMQADHIVLHNYFMATSLNFAGNEESAISSMHDAINTSEMLGGAHYLAAELIASTPMMELFKTKIDESPQKNQVRTRLEIISAFREHYSYGEPAEERDEGLTVKALGNANAYWNGEEIKELKPQALELLFLLVDRRSLDRDLIVEEFWPDHPGGRQTANLHMAIYSIRRILGKGRIKLSGSVYQIDPELKISYDVHDFEKAVDVYTQLPSADPRRFFLLTEAINAYKGRYLPEFFSDWVESRRRELELRFLDIAAAHADEAIVRDQPDRALNSLRNALSLDPYRDDLNERYLEALARLNRRSEVLKHYAAYEKLLIEDLGIEPADSVKSIRERVLGSR